MEVQNRVSVYSNFKNLLSYHDKTLPLSITKCYFGVLAVKYKQSGLSKNADTVFTSDLELTQKSENKGRKTKHSFSLFI